MLDNELSILKRLTDAYGPSGNEEMVRDIIIEEIKDYVDSYRVDPLGNLIAVKGQEGKKIMIAGHMDEIGLMVTDIDEKGFIRFTNIGGVSATTTLGQMIQFKSGIMGVVSIEHIEDIRDIKLSKMYIDIGAKNKEEAEKMVSIGDVCVYNNNFTSTEHAIISKALDDRIGCFIMIEAIKKIKETPNQLFFTFTVQEELGIRGAKTSAYGIDPDMGIALDVTGVGDTPKSRPMALKMGSGAAIKIKDMSVMCHPIVKTLMIETAKANNIPYQLEVLEYGGTDSGAIHLTRGGVPSGVISIPSRYIHSPIEMVSKSDVNNAIELLVGICNTKID
jgi:tetrahedral aminopeptidase